MYRFVTVNFCIMLCLFVGCGPSNKIAKDFDYGKIEGRVYKNDFFNFEITAPEGWHVEGAEKIAELADEGLDAYGNNKKDMEKLKETAKMTTANLWMCSKYDMNDIPDGEYNPCVIIVAEKLPASAKSLTAEKYLGISKTQTQKIVPAAMFKPITKETISGKEFAVQKNSQPIPNVPGFEIQQESRACIINNHVLLIGINYIEDAERPELQKILDTVKFH